MLDPLVGWSVSIQWYLLIPAIFPCCHSGKKKTRYSVPSRELTYPPKMGLWRWCSFSQGGICDRSLEGNLHSKWHNGLFQNKGLWHLVHHQIQETSFSVSAGHRIWSDEREEYDGIGRLPKIQKGNYINKLSNTVQGMITLVQVANWKATSLCFEVRKPFPSLSYLFWASVESCQLLHLGWLQYRYHPFVSTTNWLRRHYV